LKSLRLLLVVALLVALAGTFAPAHADGCSSKAGYYIASLSADIDPGAANFMSTTVANAEAACAGHIVFILSTNGGDGGSMESMIASISGYQQWGGNLTTLVAPQDAFAFSAGSYVAEASNKIYMTPGTTIGSATPIVSGIPTGEENTTLRKDINAFTSYMETLTSANGRNATNTGLMVSRGVSYCAEGTPTCPSALQSHVVDGVLSATTLSGALSELGRLYATTQLDASTPINTPGISSIVISIFSDPNVSSLLFLVGVFLILFDIYHPTLVLSFVGITVIALAFFGLGVFGASPLAVALMIIGAAFIFLEVKTQHGISALIGVVVFIVGFLFIFQFPPASASSPSLPATNFSHIPDITYGLLVALGAAIVIGSLYLRRIRAGLMARPKVYDSSATLGKTGEMKTDLAAGGKGDARIGGEEWSVTSGRDLKRGDQVKVIAVHGLELTVEKLEK
jgi:membrane-bound serine protease (ClpP class)